MGAADTLRIARCPYCVLGGEFRTLVPHLDRRLICPKCGHLANPGNNDFRCSCPECSHLKGVDYQLNDR